MGRPTDARQDEVAAADELTEDEIVEVFKKLDLPLLPPPQPARDVAPLVLFQVSGDSR